MSLLLLFPTQPAAAPVGVDLRETLDGLLDALNASTPGELTWWTMDDDLWGYADQAAKHLAATIGLFVERDATISTAPGTAAYNLPSRHMSTIHVSFGATPLQVVTERELEAVDTTWKTAAGTPTKATHWTGVDKIRLYKVPNSVAVLGIIHHQWPVALTAAAPVLAVPSVFADYISWFVLREARRQPGDAAMPEVADHLDQRLLLFEQVAQQYWGDPL